MDGIIIGGTASATKQSSIIIGGDTVNALSADNDSFVSNEPLPKELYNTLGSTICNYSVSFTIKSTG